MVFPPVKAPKMVKEERSAEVFLGSLRLFKTARIDSPPKKEDTDEISKLWNFITKFVGVTVNNRIKSIEVYYTGSEDGCNCGAIVVQADPETGEPDKLKEPCSCRGARAIVAFEDPQAADVMKSLINVHRNLHTQGVKQEERVNADGSVNFCSICCYNSKRLRSVTTRPVSPADQENDQESVTDESCVEGRTTEKVAERSDVAKIDENQLNAANIVLVAALGPSLINEAAVLKESIRGSTLTEAMTMVTNGVRNIFENADNKEDIPTNFPEKNIKDGITYAMALITNQKSTNQCTKIAKTWAKEFSASESGIVVGQSKDVVEGPEVEELVDNIQTVEQKDVTEDNLRKQYTGIKNVLETITSFDLTESEGVEGAESILKKLVQFKSKITAIYVEMDVEVQSSIKDEQGEKIAELNSAIKRLKVQISGFKQVFGGSTVKPVGDKESTETSEKGPDSNELHIAVSAFESSAKAYQYSYDELTDVVEDTNVKGRKNEFNAITNRIQPNIRENLANIDKVIPDFIKWLKNPKSGLNSQMKTKLQNYIQDAARYKSEWLELTTKISKVDRAWGHSQKAYEAAGLGTTLNKVKIDIFYGEEKSSEAKWQNAYEFFQKIEMQICRVVHDKDAQLYDVMSYLSPNIQRLAKAQNFTSYEELKEWLIRDCVDETKIIKQLQERITSFVPKSMSDVCGFIIHTRGIITSMTSYCADNPRLRAKLLTEQNVTGLVQAILNQISLGTTRNEWLNFLSTVWGKHEVEAVENNTQTTPEQELLAMDKYLDEVQMLAKASELHDAKHLGTNLSGPERKNSQSDYQKGPRGGYRGRGGRGRGGRSGAGHSAFSHRRDGQAYSTKNVSDFCLVVVGTQKNLNNTVKIVTTDPAEGKKMSKRRRNRNESKVFIQVNESDLKKAEAWENDRKNLKLACWLCNSKSPHELWNCSQEDHNKVTNVDRFKKARDKNFGPGTQCFSCLSSVCFLTRVMETVKNAKTVENAQVKPCGNYKRKNLNEIACMGCIEEAKKGSDGLIKSQRPMHCIICPKKEHMDDAQIKRENIKRIRDKFGSKEGNRIRIQCVMLESDLCPKIQSNNVKPQKDKNKKSPNQGSRPPLAEISEKEYKGADGSNILDPMTGGETNLDLTNKEVLKTLVKASKGIPLYFLQQFNLKGENCLAFFDSGAMFNLIRTDLARKLNLRMTTRRPMYVVGAGEHVHSTGDGKYELVLGRGSHGEKYVLEVAGSAALTGYMMQADFQESFDDVREEARKLAEEGHAVLGEEEILPRWVGGMKAGIIIGLSTPTLQPRIIMNLPNGLLVARSRLTDIHGSTICFGGMFDNYKRFFGTHYTEGLYKMSNSQVDEYTARHRACLSDYISFRDSLRMDPIYFQNGRECNPKWKEIIDRENDAMVEDSPIIIAGSEEKRGIQLQKNETTKLLVNAGKKIQFHKDIHKEGEPLRQFQVHPERTEPVEIGIQNVDRPGKSMCPFNQEVTEKVDGNDIFIESSETVDPHTLKVEELVSESFGNSKPDHQTQEGVYFQNNDSKVDYYRDFGEDLELNELLAKNSSVKIEPTKRCNIGSDGLTAFHLSTNLNSPPSDDVVKVAEECKVDHGCSCSTGDLDIIFDDVAEGLSNEDRKEWNKMKKAIRKWEDDETIGTGVDYRCSRCVNCKDCLKSSRTRARSQREEDEQKVIESSIRIDWEAKKCFVFLPWIKSPDELALRWGSKSNLKQANHFLRKMLAKSPEDRQSLVRFWEELKKRNVVTRLRDLDEDLQKQILGSAVLHFYPWNCVFKESITTPCRMVVDSRTSGLNEHLAKGLNTLNNLQQLLLRFRGYQHIGSYDISKMYNMLYIENSHLQYQLILWVDDMNPENEVEVWVMLRAIYGTISSGNQAEVAIRRGASTLEEQYPQGAYTIIHETYVDDGVPCRDDDTELKQALHEVGVILEKIGFSLKCVTVSGQKEPLSEKASSDGCTIGLAGYKYEPRKDLLSLSMKECNFNKIVRGTKKPNKHPVTHGSDIDEEIFPEELTRAQAVGKLAEMYDLIGLFMPLTMQGKIMARKIAHLDWSEIVPQEQMKDWLEICRKIQDTRHLKIKRCVIPSRAKNVKVTDLMELHDGSKEAAATVVYARCLLDDDTYSTRMLFSRSCLCPVGQDVPRNELTSSHLGATAAYISRLSIKGKVQTTYSFGDSYVAFLWSQNPDMKLKSWSFARVQDIRRLNAEAVNFWVKGTLNIADIATKGIITVAELNHDSNWHNGMPWMHLEIKEMVELEMIKDYDQVTKSLNKKDKDILAEEQNPSLPDMAAGSRKNQNPEFDISVVGTPCKKLNFSQAVKCCRTDPDLHFHSQSHQAIGMTKEVKVKNCGTEAFPPEFYAGRWFGITPDQMIRYFLDTPANSSYKSSSFLAGREKRAKNSEKLKNKAQFEDPVCMSVDALVTKYGWQKMFKATSLLVYFRYKCHHKAHQTPTPGHHLFGNITPEQQKTREGLQKSCRICKMVPEVDKESANMAYLDSVCSGIAPTITRDDKIQKKSGSQDWLPKWKMVRKAENQDWVLSTGWIEYKEADNVKLKEIQEIRKCFVTTRARSKGWLPPGRFLRKNSGKKDYKPKSRKQPVKPSQKPKKIQKVPEPTRTQDELVEEIRIGDQIKVLTWQYFCRKMSEQVTENLTNKEKEKFEFDEKEKVWKHFGRMLERRDIEYRDVEVEEFLDASTISYVQPVGMATDPIVFQIILHIHWQLHPHKGVRSTNRILANIMYAVRGGYVVRSVRDECQRCRIILKRHIKEKMGDIPVEKLVVSPPFSFVQIDTGGPFPAFSRHGQRSKVEVNAMVIVCVTTGAVSIMALEDLEAPTIVKALVRHSCRHGYPIIGYTDKGTGLRKGLGVQVELINHELLINRDVGMKIIVKPTKSHESRGKVEKVIQTLKHYLEERKFDLLTQSIMDWETTFIFISNFINNLPISRLTNNRNLNYDVTEVLTPNRLLLGRNNQRSPNYFLEEKGVTYKDRLTKNNKILQAFFTLLNRLVPELVERPIWHKSSEILPRVGDYCLFCHRESSAGKEHERWKIGLIVNIRNSESSPQSRVYVLEYRSVIKQKSEKPSEWKVSIQTTDRDARSLVILFTEEELESKIGSAEHLSRLREKITQGTKKKGLRSGKNVRQKRLPGKRRF